MGQLSGYPTNWERSRPTNRHISHAPYIKGRRSRKPKRGITNLQASYLAGLQRKAGEPYTGSGMSLRQASAEIERLHVVTGMRAPVSLR